MAVNVANIFENVIKPGKDYCRICLRTAEETTLLTPRNLRIFTEVLKLNIFDHKKPNSACYVCEASAGTALRMYQACVNAVSVKNVCNPLKTMRRNHSVPEWLRSAIVTCNANLKEYRQRSTLQQTEVLVVDSAGIEWQPEDSPNPILILAPSVPTEPPYETVVLDDEDDTPAPSNITRLVPIEQILDPKLKDQAVASLLPNQMQIISRHSEEDNHFILHPVITGPDGEVVAPSLGAYIKDNNLVFDPNIFQKLPLIDCTNNKSEVTCVIENPIAKSNSISQRPDNNETDDPVEMLPDKKKSNERRRYYGTDKRDKVLPCDNKKMESVLKNYLEKQYNYNKRSNSSEICEQDDAKKKREERQFVVDLNMVNDILSKGESDPIAVISNVMSARETDDGLGVIAEVVSRPTGLLERSGKIDWEDKIPMDVISFVDASDPNDREFIVPDPLPVKQNRQKKAPAESLTQPTVNNTQPSKSYLGAKVTNNRHDRQESQTDTADVIDLC